MRVLCVHQGFELYGSDRSFSDAVETLISCRDDLEIDVLLPREGALASAIRLLPNVSVQVGSLGIVQADDVRRPLSTLARLIPRVFDAMKRSRQYDAVYINTVVVVDYIVAARFSRAKTLVHIREIPGSAAARWAFSALLWFAGVQLVFNSHGTRRCYRLLPKQGVFTVHNGVRDESGNDIRHRLGLEPPLNLLLIGRINSWKGHHLLLDSLERLDPASLARVCLRIVGEAPVDKEHLEFEVRDRISRGTLRGVVEAVGFTPDPAEHFRWASVVIVPSTRPEPFGRVAIEAMSFGRPVFAAAHGGLPEIIDHGRSGFLFPPNDADALATLIAAVIADPSILQTQGANARRRYLERFSIDAYRSSLTTVFREVFGT